MKALLPAIALCAVLHATAVAPSPAQAAPAGIQPQQGVLHAQLAPRTDRIVVAQRDTPGIPGGASLHSSSIADPAATHEHRPTTAAMLFAALVLMTGIALRRWGAGEQ